VSHPSPELQPDLEDVLQVEEPEGRETAVKVDVTGPVRTQALPRKGGATLTKTIGTLPNPLQVLRADRRRAQSVLIGAAAFLVAYGDANAQDASTMALWPANVPLVVSAGVDVWVAASTGTTTVSVVTELWATGDGDD